PFSSLVFFLITRPPPSPTLFPYTTLFRSRHHRQHGRARPDDPHQVGERDPALEPLLHAGRVPGHRSAGHAGRGVRAALPQHQVRDRKSTRLNSSHRTISYAVFCLKKKKNK